MAPHTAESWRAATPLSAGNNPGHHSRQGGGASAKAPGSLVSPDVKEATASPTHTGPSAVVPESLLCSGCCAKQVQHKLGPWSRCGDWRQAEGQRGHSANGESGVDFGRRCGGRAACRPVTWMRREPWKVTEKARPLQRPPALPLQKPPSTSPAEATEVKMLWGERP